MNLDEREELRTRLRALKHLPKFMRDFHDQKELFKTIQSVMEKNNPETCNAVNWMWGQCYCMDVFLKFMAMHGYELRRTGRATFDLNETLKEWRKKEDEEFKKWMDERIGKPPGEAKETHVTDGH